MGADPLVLPCKNCSTPFQAVDWFCVIDRNDLFSCVYHTTTAGPPPELDLPSEHRFATDDLAVAQDAVNEHMRRIADDVRRNCLALITHGDAAGVDVQTALTKTRLAIATLFFPGVPEAREIFDDYVCGIAPWFVLDAFSRRVEPAGALDAALPYWGVYEGARARLAAMADDHDAPPAQALASAFVLAWHADRSGGRLDADVRANWIARLIASLELSHGSELALDQDFLVGRFPSLPRGPSWWPVRTTTRDAFTAVSSRPRTPACCRRRTWSDSSSSTAPPSSDGRRSSPRPARSRSTRRTPRSSSSPAIRWSTKQTR